MLEKPSEFERSSNKKQPYDNTPCQGCYLHNLTCFRTSDGKVYKPHCKSYNCEKHGWKHEKRLREALELELESWDRIRFWTFTLSSRVFESKEIHARTLSKIWRYFVTQLRRSNLLSEREQKVRYIRISETHKSGYLHFHACFDQYIHRSKILALWQRASEVVCKRSDKIAGCYVTGTQNSKSASKYISKYVTKQAKQRFKHSNLYSSSGSVVLFGKSEKEHAYAVYDKKRKIWLGLHLPSPYLVYNSQLHHAVEVNDPQLFQNLLGREFTTEKLMQFQVKRE